MTGLLPCPFCGGDAEIEEAAGSQGSGSLVVYRGNCRMVGHVALTWTPDHHEAVAAWNTRHRLASTPPRDDAERETGWLIEMANNDAPVPRWWHPQKGWVWDANDALRFARKQDAEDFARSRLHGAGGKATEHAWG